MRTLILTDIHANAVALSAVLATPEAQSCQEVISLGDQVNYGCEPRRCLDLLRDFSRQGRPLTMLMGNHEDRLTRLSDPDLSGYNWELLRWTARQVPQLCVPGCLPRELRRGPVLFTHAVPGDLYRLVDDEGLGEALETLPDGVRLLLCGHSHSPHHVCRAGREAVNPGSLGMLEGGSGLTAPFAVLETHGDEYRVTRCEAHYAAHDTVYAALRSGYWRCMPEFARAILLTLLDGQLWCMRLMQAVVRAADALGTTPRDRAAWRAADEAFPWPNSPLPSFAYWTQMLDALP